MGIVFFNLGCGLGKGNPGAVDVDKVRIANLQEWLTATQAERESFVTAVLTNSSLWQSEANLNVDDPILKKCVQDLCGGLDFVIEGKDTLEKAEPGLMTKSLEQIIEDCLKWDPDRYGPSREKYEAMKDEIVNLLDWYSSTDLEKKTFVRGVFETSGLEGEKLDERVIHVCDYLDALVVDWEESFEEADLDLMEKPLRKVIESAMSQE